MWPFKKPVNPARSVICIPGNWKDFEDFHGSLIVSSDASYIVVENILINGQGKRHYSFEFCERDPRMETSFRVAGRVTEISDETLVEIADHKYVIYISGDTGIKKIELITNSFNSSAFKIKPRTHELLKISQGVTIKRIPVLQTPKGPIIDRIETIREANFLIDFRDRILQSNNPENFTDLVAGIETEFQKYRNDILLQKQKGSRLITSIGNNALSFLIGTFIPGAGEIKSLASDAVSRNFNWTGFLAELENN
jgi:hypothetical protein